MVPQCRRLNTGIFRESSHKINMRWIQVQVNGSPGLGAGPGGAVEGRPLAFSDRWGRADSHSGSTRLLGHFPGSWGMALICGCVQRRATFRHRNAGESVIPLADHRQRSSAPGRVPRRQWEGWITSQPPMPLLFTDPQYFLLSTFKTFLLYILTISLKHI